MFNENEYTLAQLRHEQEVRQAEAKQAQREHLKQRAEDQAQPFYAEPLAKTGVLLVQLGEALQNRYGELVEEAQQMSYDPPKKAKPQTSSPC